MNRRNLGRGTKPTSLREQFGPVVGKVVQPQGYFAQRGSTAIASEGGDVGAAERDAARPWAARQGEGPVLSLLPSQGAHPAHGVTARNFKVGSGMDIAVSGAIHERMAHKVYHGRTAIVWDATKRTVVVVMNEQVGNTTIQKRIQKHVQPSRCPEEFTKRRKSKYSRKAVAKREDTTVDLKRQPVGPRSGLVLDAWTLETSDTHSYDVVNDLKRAYGEPVGPVFFWVC